MFQSSQSIRQQFDSFKMDQFLMYLPSSFIPDSGLSVAASWLTKQIQAAQHAVERCLQIQINVVENLETHLNIAEW